MVASYEQQEDAAFRQEVDSVKQWFTVSVAWSLLHDEG